MSLARLCLFIHGLDPLDFANLNGVRDYVQSLGYIKTYYGQLYHSGYFTDEMRLVHQRDPDARFALVGFSFGANKVRNIANAVRDDGINIDLLVYLGGNTLTNDAEDRPPNVTRIVNILATGCIWNGTELDNAANVHYDNAWHFGSPSHPRTLEILAHELTETAARVPQVERVYPLVQNGPTPRPEAVQPQREQRDEWDFLLPGGAIPETPQKPVLQHSAAGN